MNNFFKMFLASLTALIVFSILPFFIMVAIVSSIGAASDAPVVVKGNSILVVDLSKPIVNDISTNTFDYFDFKSMNLNMPTTVDKAVQSIYAAANDSRIISLYIDARNYNAIALTSLEELRRSIEFFKSKDKKVYSYASSYDNSSYYISSVADKVVIAPLGNLFLTGLSSDVMYYKGLFDKVGVNVDLIRVGKYKSAGEPLISETMSKYNRLQLESMLGSMWGVIVDDISASRGVSPVEINKMVNDMSVIAAKGALDNKMVDSVLYYNEFRDMLNKDEKSDYISLNKYASTIKSFRSLDEDGKPILTSKNKIAYLVAEGNIIDGKSGDGTVGDHTMCEKISKLRKDSTVKAVVFRINSPGGSAMSSEYMWNELRLLQKEKPLIVSMGTYAASGGYYIAAPADYIFAESTTLTGSIGVFSTIFNAEKLIDKFGVNIYNVSTNDNSGLTGGMLYRGLNSTEKMFLKGMTEDIYRTFKERVSQGRNLTMEQVENLAQGRVWSGVQAVDNGLVDEIGGVTEAINMAAVRAGVQDDFILVQPKVEDNPFAAVMNIMNAKVTELRTPDFGILQSEYNYIMSFNNKSTTMAIMPYMIKVQ